MSRPRITSARFVSDNLHNFPRRGSIPPNLDRLPTIILRFVESTLNSQRLNAMKKLLLFAGLSAVVGQTAFGWDYEGHRLVNQLALSALPKDFPAFALTPEAQERIAFLAGEPDRWRNTPNLELQHSQEPEHFFDLEELSLYGLTPATLPIYRYEFVSTVAAAHKAHPENFSESRDDKAHKYGWTGLLPWTITENYAKLKSEFSYLKTFETEGGTPAEIANAKENIIYTMGVMGHYVGDAAQPLHTTKYFNGWTGENPNHYTTNHIHGWIDGGYIAKANIEDDLGAMKMKMQPAQIVTLNGHPAASDQVFSAVVGFIVDQNKMVEALYKLDKEHKLTGDGELGLQGKPVIEGQLIKGGEMLSDIWLSAWKQATVDDFLSKQLHRRTQSAPPVRQNNQYP
jgi:hypothetical protein